MALLNLSVDRIPVQTRVAVSHILLAARLTITAYLKPNNAKVLNGVNSAYYYEKVFAITLGKIVHESVWHCWVGASFHLT